MPDARRLFAQRRLAGVLQRQCQQAIGQGRHRAEQGIPEDHREEALVALPEQMAVHPADQVALAAAQDPQIAFGDMEGRLGLLAPPGVAERPEVGHDVAAAETVDHHQKMQRKAQPAIGQRLQQCQQQGQRQQRQDHREQQPQPGAAGHRGQVLDQAQPGEPGAIALDTPAPAGELLQRKGQQQHQERHVSSLESVNPAR